MHVRTDIDTRVDKGKLITTKYSKSVGVDLVAVLCQLLRLAARSPILCDCAWLPLGSFEDLSMSEGGAMHMRAACLFSICTGYGASRSHAAMPNYLTAGLNAAMRQIFHGKYGPR